MLILWDQLDGKSTHGIEFHAKLYVLKKKKEKMSDKMCLRDFCKS